MLWGSFVVYSLGVTGENIKFAGVGLVLVPMASPGG